MELIDGAQILELDFGNFARLLRRMYGEWKIGEMSGFRLGRGPTGGDLNFQNSGDYYGEYTWRADFGRLLRRIYAERRFWIFENLAILGDYYGGCTERGI